MYFFKIMTTFFWNISEFLHINNTRSFHLYTIGFFIFRSLKKDSIKNLFQILNEVLLSTIFFLSFFLFLPLCNFRKSYLCFFTPHPSMLPDLLHLYGLLQPSVHCKRISFRLRHVQYKEFSSQSQSLCLPECFLR